MGSKSFFEVRGATVQASCLSYVKRECARESRVAGSPPGQKDLGCQLQFPGRGSGAQFAVVLFSCLWR